MKKMLKMLSLTLALVMMVMSMPVFVTAAEVAENTCYWYANDLLYNWGGAKVSAGPWWSTWTTVFPDAKVVTDTLAGPKNSNSVAQLPMETRKSDLSSWQIAKESWSPAINVPAPAVAAANLHFQLRLENMQSAAGLKVLIGSSTNSSAYVAIPDAATITSDGLYHDVFIPLSSFDYDFTKAIEFIRISVPAGVSKIDENAVPYAYVYEIEFCAETAVALKAEETDTTVKLTWTNAQVSNQKTDKLFTPTGYKVYCNDSEIAIVDNATEYTFDKVDGINNYKVVPYNADGELTQYASNIVEIEYDDGSGDEGETPVEPVEKVCYWYANDLLYNWGGAKVSAGPWWSTWTTVFPDAKVVTDTLAGPKNSNSVAQLPMETRTSDLSSWQIAKESWSPAINVPAPAVAAANLHFQLRLENIQSAAGLKVLIGNSTNSSAYVAIPDAATITSDGLYHDVFIPLSSFDYDFTKAIEFIRISVPAGVSKIDENAVPYAYVYHIEFCADTATVLAAEETDSTVKLTWTNAVKATGKKPAELEKLFAATGYKVYCNDTQVANIEGGSTFEYACAKTNGRNVYKVVPYDANGNMTQYTSNSIVVDVNDDFKVISKIYDSKVASNSANTYPWNSRYNGVLCEQYDLDKYYDLRATRADASFIPATTYAIMMHAGADYEQYIYYPDAPAEELRVERVEIKCPGVDISDNTTGSIGMMVYIDTDTSVETTDITLKVGIASEKVTGEIKVAPYYAFNNIPANDWTMITVPISYFGSDYDMDYLRDVRFSFNASEYDKCDIYIQDISVLMPAVTCEEAYVTQYDAEYDAEYDEEHNAYILEAGESDYAVKMKVKNGSSSPIKPVFIVALYNDGTLVDTYIPEPEKTVAAGDEYTYTAELPEIPDEDGANYYVKGFMWKDWASIAPIVKD